MTTVTAALLGLVFAYSGAVKLRRPSRVSEAAVGLGVPVRYSAWIAWLLPVAEISVGAALFVPSTREAAAVVAVLMLVAFSALILRALRMPARPACGCFGTASSKPIGWTNVVRNAFLLLCAVFCVWNPDTDVADAWATRHPWLVALVSSDVILAVGLSACAAFLFALFQQHGRLLASLRDTRDAEPSSPTSQAIQGLEVGVSIPELHVTTLGGDAIRLRVDTTPEEAMLLIFVDPGCGPCRALVDRLRDVPRGVNNLPLTRFVSRGAPNANRELFTGYDDDAVVLQEQWEVSLALGVTGTPSALTIDHNGRIAAPMAVGADAIMEAIVRSRSTSLVRNSNDELPDSAADRSTVVLPTPSMRL